MTVYIYIYIYLHIYIYIYGARPPNVDLFVCLHLSCTLLPSLQREKISPTQPFKLFNPFQPFLRGKVWAQNRLNRLNR